MTKRQDLSDDMMDVIGQRQPISLSLIQCHGNNITASGLQRMFQHCGSHLEVSVLRVGHCGLQIIHSRKLLMQGLQPFP